MESFGLNSARSYLGKTVNLHLKDGSVIINVQLTRIRKGNFGKGNFIEYNSRRTRRINYMPLQDVAWAEMLNLNLLQKDD
jgi:hypothetical protein